MKKIFLALAAVAAISACSKSDVEYNQPSEIAFSPVIKNITKTMMNGTTQDTIHHTDTKLTSISSTYQDGAQTTVIHKHSLTQCYQTTLDTA